MRSGLKEIDGKVRVKRCCIFLDVDGEGNVGGSDVGRSIWMMMG